MRIGNRDIPISTLKNRLFSMDSAGCELEMGNLLSCFAANEYSKAACASLIEVFQQCVIKKKHLNRLRARTWSSIGYHFQRFAKRR